MKKFAIITSLIASLVSISGFIIIMAVAIGIFAGKQAEASNYQRIEVSGTIVNNQIYAYRYRNLLEKHLKVDGYVTLERLIFYLQRTKNVLDVTTLSDEEWENAYKSNIDIERKQMIPIKTICKTLKTMDIPEYTIQSGTNDSGVQIDKLDLCTVGEIDISSFDEYSEEFVELPYVSPFSKDITYSLTSMVFEYRNVNLDLSQSEQNRVNYHSGWDLAIPIGTDFRSICDGRIINIVNTQFNDLNYNQQLGEKNATGNYINVECNNGYIVQYYHLKANSVYGGKKIGDAVSKGEVLAKTSTTGLSTGPHLHLGLKTKEGTQLDAFSFIDFVEE